MSRPSTEHYDLPAEEKRDLIKRIELGKPLPEKYRFLLFEDKREVELVWNGKSRDVCTAVLPFQTLEHIDEPRSETPASQEELFDRTDRQIKGWANKLIWGGLRYGANQGLTPTSPRNVTQSNPRRKLLRLVLLLQVTARISTTLTSPTAASSHQVTA